VHFKNFKILSHLLFLNSVLLFGKYVSSIVVDMSSSFHARGTTLFSHNR